MNVDMGSIVISIESTTEKASNAIDSLISKLNELQTALSNVGKSSNGFSKIKDSIPKVSSKTPSVLNKSNAKEQLDSLKPDLKGFDVASVFSSQNTKGVTTEITKYKNAIGDVVTVQKKMRDGMDDYYRVTKKTTTDGVSAFDKFKNSVIGTATKIAAMVAGAKNLANTFSELVETSAEYTEAVNLFYTEMGDKAQEAEKFVKRFSDALYLDPSDIMRYMGSFNSLVSGLGVGADNSYKMSKNLTQLAYDLASYKNIDVESAFDKLQSGVAGQIKGLRQVGVALSQNTLQELANEMGITQRINTLDEASKAQLRYIQIMRSSTNWQGDLGKTMMSTENILRSARQQWTLMVRAFGDVAAVIARVVMPYFIALTQIVKEAAVALARFFGVDIDFSDRFKDGGKSASVGLGKIEDGIGGVGSAAKKAKKDINTMLAPFDNLNVVQTKVESADSGIGGVTGGASLGDLPLPEYDALSKLTGEWSDKIAQAKEKIKSIIPIAKKLLEIFGILWLVGKIAKFINNIKTVGSAFNSLKTLLTKVGSLFKTLITRFSDGYKYSQALGGKGLSAILSGTRNLLGPLGKLGITVAGVVASFVTGYKEMKNYTKGNEELSSALAKTTAVTTAFGVAAFALVGWPAALAVGIAGLTGALVGYAQGLHEIEVHNEIFNKKGIEIKALSDGMKVSFDKTAESTLKYANTISDLREKYTNAKSEMDFARQGVDDFMNALLLQDGTISKSQISELKDKYTQLKESTKEARKTHDEYHIALIKSLDEQAGKSAESTAKQIADYKKLQSALKGYEDEYLDAEYELNLKRANGKISQEEYNKEIENLKVAYGLAVPKVWDTTNALSVFNNNLSEIDYKSVEDTNTAIKDVKTSLDKNIKAVEEYRDGVKKQNDEEIASYKEKMTNLELAYGGYDKLSGKQKEIYDTNAKAVSRLEKETADVIERSNKTIEEMQSSYKGYMEGIYADLVSKGANTSKEFKGTINTLKEEISGLKNVDASGIGEKLKDDVIDSIIKNKPEMIVAVRTALGSVGGSGGQALEAAFMKILNESKPNFFKYADEKLGKPAAEGATDGLNKGVTENKKSITDAGQKLGDYLINGSRQSLGWHSPSTVYAQAGKDVILGFKNGLENNKKLLINTMTTILNDLNKTTSKELKNIKFEINTTTFQNSLDKLLGKLQTFANKFRSGVNSLMSSFTTSMNGIKVTSDNKITYTKMPNISIPRFDEGGYPDNASLYWMNENGIPEMLGNVGNKTAVVNNDQIITAMTNAMVSALSGMNFGGQGTTIVNIGNKKVYEGMGEYIDGENERYGTAYVNI